DFLRAFLNSFTSLSSGFEKAREGVMRERMMTHDVKSRASKFILLSLIVNYLFFAPNFGKVFRLKALIRSPQAFRLTGACILTRVFSETSFPPCFISKRRLVW